MKPLSKAINSLKRAKMASKKPRKRPMTSRRRLKLS
jgi:hypothetical protein